MGIDVAGFCSDLELHGDWHNYQCKHYDHALRPSDIWVEIGKVIYYSYKGFYLPPKRYFFVAPRNIGTTLGRYLSDTDTLRKMVIQNWAKYCESGITKLNSVPLSGEFFRMV